VHAQLSSWGLSAKQPAQLGRRFAGDIGSSFESARQAARRRTSPFLGHSGPDSANVNKFTLDQNKRGGSSRSQMQKSNGVRGIKILRIPVSQNWRRPLLVAAQCPGAACPQPVKADTASAAQLLVTHRNLSRPSARSHSCRAFVQRGLRVGLLSSAGLEAPGRALAGRSWKGLGRRPAMAGGGLEIACWPVCRSGPGVQPGRPCAEGHDRRDGRTTAIANKMADVFRAIVRRAAARTKHAERPHEIRCDVQR
jgi:hypothetical protein